MFVYMDRVHRAQSKYICRFIYTLKKGFSELVMKEIEGRDQFKQSGLKFHMWKGGNSRSNSLFSPSVPPFAPFSVACVPSPMLAEHPRCYTHGVFFRSGSQIAAFLFISIYVSTTLYSAYHPLTGPCQWALIFCFLFFFPYMDFLIDFCLAIGSVQVTCPISSRQY